MTQVTNPKAALPAEATSVWRDPDFRRLWRAAAFSRFGSEIGELALPLLAIITLSAQASEVGVLRSAQFLPFLVATLPFGVLVDRSAKRRLMIVADLGRFVLIAAIPLAVWLGLRQIELLYVLVFAAGSLTVLYQLAEFAFVPVVAPPDRSSMPTAGCRRPSPATRSPARASAV